MRTFIAALVAALCWSLAGCGSSAEDKQANKEAQASASAQAEASALAEAEASASAAAEARKAARLEAARTAQQKCTSALGDLQSALKQIDGRLDVGLTNSDMGNRLGDVAVAYNSIPFKKLGPECIAGAGVPLEGAYNEYTKADTAWDACIQDYSCTVEGAKLAELQAHWSKASREIARASRFLSTPKGFMNT